jgi:hypothetical protein
MPEFSGWLLDLFEDPREGLVLYFIDQKGRAGASAGLPGYLLRAGDGRRTARPLAAPQQAPR